MDFKGCEAERKFWRTPELIERLLLLLDEKSTLVLAQSHVRTLNVIIICSRLIIIDSGHKNPAIIFVKVSSVQVSSYQV